MQKGITRHDCTQVLPVTRMIYQFFATGIIQNIETGFFKRSAQPIFFPQHAVMRLFLQFKIHAAGRTPRQFHGQIFAQKFHGVALIAVDA